MDTVFFQKDAKLHNRKPQTQPYTVYNLDQVIQNLVLITYQDAFDVHNNYAPILKKSEGSPFNELNQISLNMCSAVTTVIQRIDPRSHTFLRKFNFQHSKLKAAPYKTFSFSAVIFLHHVLTKNKIRPTLNEN